MSWNLEFNNIVIFKATNNYLNKLEPGTILLEELLSRDGQSRKQMIFLIVSILI